MKNIKYCIISVDNRSVDNIIYNKNILKDFQYIDNIDFIDGRKEDAFKILKNYKISTDNWNPADKRIVQEMINTEAATWVSNINIYKYIVLNNIDELLVIEDDVILDINFMQNFKKIYKELNKKYDFLSFFYFENQNKEDDNNNLKLKYIQKSYNQKSAFQCMMFSNAGAKKILKYLEDNGIFYTNDCQVFKLSEMGVLNGYSIRPNTLSFAYHDQSIQSIIDPDNLRNNE
jgi:GR25 family glycosyltransferase involved in LPS biosynthesis